MVETTLLEQLKSMLSWKKSKKYYAEKLNITEKEVEELLVELKNSSSIQEEAAKFAAEFDKTTKVNNDKGTLESVVESSFEPKDDVELAELHKVDLTKYKISSYWSKLKSNGKFTSSLLATLKKPTDYSLEDFSKFLSNYSPKCEYVKKDLHVPTEVDVEISIADFHLAKKTLEKETLLDREKIFDKILTDLLKNLSSFEIDRIVFPISNDFFHTDNYQNQTTNGTPQDVLTGFDNEYEVGFDILVKAITKLRSVANEVNVILVQGNHDRTKSFYLAHALEIFFKNDDGVVFQREHSTTKSIVLGETFIGYHHGNCKIDDLPLLFATGKTTSADFGCSKYREIHTADKHFYMAKEVKGVRIQQMPSLSGTDRWHLDNNYVNNIRAGLALIYHPIYGKIGEFESRI